MGKVIGGGLPAAAYGGSRELMERIAPAGDVYQAGTLSGNPLAVAAGLATLAQLDAAAYARLGELTDRLADGPARPRSSGAAPASRGPASPRVPGLVTLFFARRAPARLRPAPRPATSTPTARFCRAMLERGVYPPPSQFEAWFVSLAHDDEAIDAHLRGGRRVASGEALRVSVRPRRTDAGPRTRSSTSPTSCARRGR